MGRILADDAGLWRRAVRDVAPLPDRGHAPHSSRSTAAAAAEGRESSGQSRADSGRAALLPAAVPEAPLDRFAGVDRATCDRLKRGRYPLAARLDLHGMTQQEAFRALSGFVTSSRAAGRRCVLVITGHGRSSGGVLRMAVPRWLAEPVLRPHVLALAPARPKDGGAGALYLLLRRPPH